MNIPTFSQIIEMIKGVPSHEEIQQNLSPKKEYSLREEKLRDEDLEEFKHILFAEVSNRPDDKKKIEADVITNTVLNRMKEYRKKSKERTFTEVMQMPNQYQGYAPNGIKNDKGELVESQYQKSKTGNLDELSKGKRKFVDDYVESLKSGDIIDNTEGAYFYIHNPDESITYDNLKPLFK